MLAAVSQLLSIITYSLYDYTVMIQLAPWISLKDSSEKVLESIPAGILSNKMLKKKKKKDFSSSRNSSRLSPVQLLIYWRSANELERVVGWSISVDEDEARDLATARLPHGSFNNSRVGGGWAARGCWHWSDTNEWMAAKPQWRGFVEEKLHQIQDNAEEWWEAHKVKV